MAQQAAKVTDWYLVYNYEEESRLKMQSVSLAMMLFESLSAKILVKLIKLLNFNHNAETSFSPLV